jgi:hypothetical protein
LTTIYYHQDKLDLAKENQLKALKYFDYYCKMRNVKKNDVVNNRLKFKSKQLKRELESRRRQAEFSSSSSQVAKVKSPEPIKSSYSYEANEEIRATSPKDRDRKREEGEAMNESKLLIQNHEFTPKSSSRQMDEDLANEMAQLILNDGLMLEKRLVVVDKPEEDMNEFGYDRDESPEPEEKRGAVGENASKANIKVIKLKKNVSVETSQSNEDFYESDGENGEVGGEGGMSMHASMNKDNYGNEDEVALRSGRGYKDNEEQNDDDDVISGVGSDHSGVEEGDDSEEERGVKKLKDYDADDRDLVKFKKEIERQE